MATYYKNSQGAVVDSGGKIVTDPTALSGAAGGATTQTGALDAFKNLPAYDANGTSSSSSVRNEENKIKSEINDAYANLDMTSVEKNLADAYKQSDKLLKDRLNELDTSASDQYGLINKQFDTAIADTKTNQNKETATFNAGLARIGGYLGGSASSMGAINTLENTHRLEIASLEAKRANALQAARDAVANKRFDYAKELAQSAKDLQTTIADRKDKFFNQTLQYTQNQRQDTEFRVKQANDQLDNLVTGKINPSTQDVLSIAQNLNTSPDNVLKIIQAKRQSLDLKEAQDRSEFDIKILNALDNIPKGQFVTINGKTYEGLKGGSETINKNNEFEAAKAFINSPNNQDLSAEEISSYLRQYTKNLTDGDISTLIKSAGPRNSEINYMAKNLLTNEFDPGFFDFNDETDLEASKKRIKKAIDLAVSIKDGQLKKDNSGIQLTKAIKDKLKAQVDSTSLQDINDLLDLNLN